MKRKYSLKLVMESYLNEDKQKLDSNSYSISHDGGRETFHRLKGKELEVKHIDPSGKTDQVVKMTIQKSKSGEVIGYDDLGNPREVKFQAKEYGIKSGETVNDPYTNSLVYVNLEFPDGFEVKFKRVGVGGKRADYYNPETDMWYNYSVKGFGDAKIETDENWKVFDQNARVGFFGLGGDSKRKSVLGSELAGYHVYRGGKKYKPLKRFIADLVTDAFANVDVNKAFDELDKEMGNYDKEKPKDLNESLSRGSLYRRRYRRY